jgi:glycine/D-amino acid oxidase-like deaminating enzyme
VPFDLREWPMLLLAVEEAELAHARAYAAAVGGVEVDLREESWLADDLAGGFLVEGGVTLDAMGATTAAAEAARRAGARFAPGSEA